MKLCAPPAAAAAALALRFGQSYTLSSFTERASTSMKREARTMHFPFQAQKIILI